MSKIQRLQANARMCEVYIYNNTVYLTGQVATNSAGQEAYAQTQEVLNAIDSLLAKPVLIKAIFCVRKFS